jgi:hypothetical protein
MKILETIGFWFAIIWCLVLLGLSIWVLAA